VRRLTLLLLLAAACSSTHTNDDSERVTGAFSATLAGNGRCAVADRPDKRCTPGAQDVSLSTRPLEQTICRAGFAADQRKRLSAAVKVQVYDAYGVPPGDRGAKFVLDHLVPIEAGGSPDSFSNLWPQTVDSARRKDRAESAAHRDVCARKSTLDQAAQLFETGRW
jgi:hypothetical protein